jgi:hypothetical protein
VLSPHCTVDVYTLRRSSHDLWTVVGFSELRTLIRRTLKPSRTEAARLLCVIWSILKTGCRVIWRVVGEITCCVVCMYTMVFIVCSPLCCSVRGVAYCTQLGSITLFFNYRSPTFHFNMKHFVAAYSEYGQLAAWLTEYSTYITGRKVESVCGVMRFCNRLSCFRCVTVARRVAGCILNLTCIISVCFVRVLHLPVFVWDGIFICVLIHNL